MMQSFIERQLTPVDTPLARTLQTLVALFIAFIVSGLLFIPFGTDPFSAYGSLFSQAFGSMRGFGRTLVQAIPLILIAQATVLVWRGGLAYIGFEGCFLVGAAGAAWVALGGTPQGISLNLPHWLFWPAVLLFAFSCGAIWAGFVGWLRLRFGGNDVLISLMTNYLATFLVQYLVSGPMRAPGNLPQTPRLPIDSWLTLIIPHARVHAGLLIAIVATALVWWLIRCTATGYEIIVSGMNAKVARYAGIDVMRRQMLAICIGGGLAALAGLCAVLGVQHRLMDGLAGGIGFVGIIVALLARLNPMLVIPVAILYGGLEVGGSAMQRQQGLPTSVILILESLIVLLLLGTEILRYYRINWQRLHLHRQKNIHLEEV